MANLIANSCLFTYPALIWSRQRATSNIPSHLALFLVSLDSLNAKCAVNLVAKFVCLLIGAVQVLAFTPGPHGRREQHVCVSPSSDEGQYFSGAVL